MNIPENIRIVIDGQKGGTLEIFEGEKKIYHGEGINFNRATHWSEDYENQPFTVAVLEAIAECTNYVGVSHAKLDRQD